MSGLLADTDESSEIEIHIRIDSGSDSNPIRINAKESAYANSLNIGDQLLHLLYQRSKTSDERIERPIDE